MFQHRNAWMAGVAGLVLLSMFAADPDKGLSVAIFLQRVFMASLAIVAAHFARKVLFPYVDISALVAKSAETSEGSGRIVLAIGIVIAALLMVFSVPVNAQDVRTFIPAGAHTYVPVLKAEQERWWLDHPAPELLASLVEHESCITLKHSRCWNPASRLKTSREEGAGLGQITRAWRPDGTLRFDSLAEMRDKHPALREWSWDNVYQRPDLQLRAVVLMSRDNYKRIRLLVDDDVAALAFSDAAYNGGWNGMQADRRMCQLKAGCDPQKWFAHVEHTCTKSKAPLYGNRSACDINRFHVTDVILIRSPKYRPLMRA
jgi:hypothetical protein